MSKTAMLNVRILADAKGASAGFQEAESKLDKLESGATKAAQGMSVASAGVIALGKQAFDAASSLQQSTGAVESIYKEQANQITQLAAKADEAVGLSKNQYQELASVIGAQLKNMGVSSDELVGQTDDLIKKGADLAATFGGSTSDAVAALSSLMKGEADPIERYGVSIKESNIQAELAAQGLDKLEGEAAKTARTQAIMKLLNEQTADAVGAFGREANTAAGQQERARAAWENSKATLGEALLPVVSKVAEQLKVLSGYVSEHPKAFQAAAAAIVGVTAALWGIVGGIKAWHAATEAMRLAQSALNTVMKANPIGLVVTAIAALVAGFIYAYNHSETFRNAVNKFVADAKQGFTNMVAWVQSVGKSINDTAAAASKWVSEKMDAISDRAKAVRDWFASIADAIANAFRKVLDWIQRVINKIKELIEWLKNAAGFGGGGIFGGGPAYFAAPPPSFTGAPALPVLLGRPAAPDLTARIASPRPIRIGAISQPAPSRPVVNITINGAVDPYSTAREVSQLLDQYDLVTSW